MRKKILKLLFIALLPTLPNCAHNPPDDPVCVEVSPSEGFCVHPMSGRQFTWNEKNKYLGRTWWEQRPAMIQVPAPTWAANKAYVIKMCKQYNTCDKSVTNWERTVQSLDSKIQQRMP